MAKVHGVHEIVLNPGVSGEQFEQFFVQEVLPGIQLPGVHLHLWKGDRGERAGQYAVVLEIDGVEARDRNFPTESTESDEVQRLAEMHQELFERWEALASLPDDERTIYTDYVTLGE